jgi:urease accessory protein
MRAERPSLELLPLVRVLQLASPALPIGAYSYSQGLEWAVEAQTVHDAAGAQSWIGDLLTMSVARGEAPIVWRLLRAARCEDWEGFARWNAWFCASRETSELLAETLQMGSSLVKLAVDLDLVGVPLGERLPSLAPIALPAAYALAAQGFALPADTALAGYVWSWLENQVLAAIKLVPLGQRAGQRMLMALAATIPDIVATAATIADEEISTFAPGLALASARHETQRTRIFRS